MISEALLMDNMEYMAQFPDGYFDLAVVDPPYGIGASGLTYGKRKIKHSKKNWDIVPNDIYFEELFRVSKNQIIWGGNYFNLPLTNGWLIWDKLKGKETTFSDGEMAWTNFLNLLNICKVRYDGFIGMDEDIRFHPTQKPIKLYDRIYAKYLPEGGKVIDTHLGSGSNRIAADKAGNIDFYSCELDPEYHAAQEKRFRNYKSQLVMEFH